MKFWIYEIITCFYHYCRAQNCKIQMQVFLFSWTALYLPYLTISREAVGESARDNPKRYWGWF